MAKTQVTKTDYSLAIRYKKSDGQWSEWKEYGKGQFQSIEMVQLQMRIAGTLRKNVVKHFTNKGLSIEAAENLTEVGVFKAEELLKNKAK
jgi:hypothetical protein